ncbi:MAG: tyrosine-type recombinase/integrase [Calditrichaeota bacterium]|jgi:integrase|nr:tyrosine-type recombinase/integrase [Calditrichota bacterium]
MGSHRIQGKNHYYRIIRDKSLSPQEVKIPLGQDHKLALLRIREIKPREEEIKFGLEVDFSWLQKTVGGEKPSITLTDAIEKYLVARKADRIRKSTLENYEYGLNKFAQIIGENFILNKIGTSQIDQFKIAYMDSLSPSTLNIILRTLKTFFSWGLDRDLIAKIPKIKFVLVPTQDPVYLSNQQFEAICDNSEDCFSRAWWFYRESGCRLAEPFYAEINGNFLTVKADTAKGKRTRDIFLTSRMKEIVLEMRSTTHLREQAKPYKLGYRHNQQRTHEINYYSRQFLTAARAAGITNRHLHHLRHTAAVRKYLLTRDIYEVSRLLGHASITTTEIYTRLNIKRLEQDFPDLVQNEGFGMSLRRVGS